MQTHDQLQERIPPFVARRLDATQSRELELHLATCVECQELVAYCEEIAAGVRDEAGVAEAAHPAPMRLREHALEGRTDERIAAHLEHCVSCALEVAVWKRDAPAVAARPVRAAISTPWLSWFAWRPLALGAALGVVVMLGVFLTLEDPETPASRASWSGTAAPLVLREALRGSGTGDPPSYRVPPGQPFIPLELELTVPLDATAGERYEFEVRTEDGSTTLDLEATAEAIRSQLRRSGTFLLYLDAGCHPTGSYTISVRDGDDLLREQAFRIES